MRRVWFIFLLLMGASSHAQVVYQVDSTLDQPDASPGDGLCAIVGGGCTLRAAMQEVLEGPAMPGGREIRVPPGVYELSHAEGDAPIDFDSGDLDLRTPPGGGNVTLAGWDGGRPDPDDRPVIVAAPGFKRRLLAVSPAADRILVSDLIFEGAHPESWDESGSIDPGAAISCQTQQPGTMELQRVRFGGNQVAGAGGGAVYSNGCRLELTDVEFDGNCGRVGTLVSGYQQVPTMRYIRMDRVSFTRNVAQCLAGPLPQQHALVVQSNLQDEAWDIAISNVTLGANLGAIAFFAHEGGMSDQRNVTLRNLTLQANSPSYLGYDGLAIAGDVTVRAGHSMLGKGSLVAGGARLVSLGYVTGNIQAESGGSYAPASTDFGNVPLALKALQRIGGYTQGYPLHPVSLLIDAGEPIADEADLAACKPADQAGLARPLGAACDIGALEFAGVFRSGFE